MLLFARVCIALGAFFVSMLAHSLPEHRVGKVHILYVDPSDVVFVFDGELLGPCGSRFFHIRRSEVNFPEFYSMVLAAFSSGKNLDVEVSECAGIRNILSKGSAF